jgi:hypothetical protein
VLVDQAVVARRAVQVDKGRAKRRDETCKKKEFKNRSGQLRKKEQVYPLWRNNVQLMLSPNSVRAKTFLIFSGANPSFPLHRPKTKLELYSSILARKKFSGRNDALETFLHADEKEQNKD